MEIQFGEMELMAWGGEENNDCFAFARPEDLMYSFHLNAKLFAFSRFFVVLVRVGGVAENEIFSAPLEKGCV